MRSAKPGNHLKTQFSIVAEGLFVKLDEFVSNSLLIFEAPIVCKYDKVRA